MGDPMCGGNCFLKVQRNVVASQTQKVPSEHPVTITTDLLSFDGNPDPDAGVDGDGDGGGVITDSDSDFDSASDFVSNFGFDGDANDNVASTANVIGVRCPCSNATGLWDGIFTFIPGSICHASIEPS